MSRRLAPTLGLFAILVAACGGGATATGGTSSAAPAASAAASAAAPSSAGSAACSVSTATPTVAGSMQNTAFNPTTIQAKVGDVIGFTNKDSIQHTATLDDMSCTTGIVAGGATAALTFTAAGTYPFHCEIHPNMTGKIEISG
jgi:plastocyanin